MSSACLCMSDILGLNDRFTADLVTWALEQPCPCCHAKTRRAATANGLYVVCAQNCGWRFSVDAGPLILDR